jgi:prevent-host-death family protein
MGRRKPVLDQLDQLVSGVDNTDMEMVNIYETKTHLSRLIERANAGEEIVIARAGKPVARLVAYVESAKPRVGGQWAGKVRIGQDFDDPLPDEIQRAFDGLGD